MKESSQGDDNFAESSGWDVRSPVHGTADMGDKYEAVTFEVDDIYAEFSADHTRAVDAVSDLADALQVVTAPEADAFSKSPSFFHPTTFLLEKDSGVEDKGGDEAKGNTDKPGVKHTKQRRRSDGDESSCGSGVEGDGPIDSAEDEEMLRNFESMLWEEKSRGGRAEFPGENDWTDFDTALVRGSEWKRIPDDFLDRIKIFPSDRRCDSGDDKDRTSEYKCSESGAIEVSFERSRSGSSSASLSSALLPASEMAEAKVRDDERESDALTAPLTSWDEGSTLFGGMDESTVGGRYRDDDDGLTLATRDDRDNNLGGFSRFLQGILCGAENT